MTARRPVLLAALLVVCSLVAAVPAGPASAAPPPEAVCGVCGDGLESAADDAGLALTVERGAATIDVRDNGTGHWHARVRIDGDAADRLRANETLRERVVRASLDRRTVVDDPRNLRTRVENATLVVDFDVAGVAHRGAGGVVLVDLLDWRTRAAGLRLDADELRIRGPNGTAVTRAPPGATAEGRSVVWRSADSDGFGGDTRLAFARSDGVVAQSLTTIAIVAYGVALAGPGVVPLGVIPAVALCGAVLGLRRWGGALPAVDPGLVAKGIAGGGVVVAAVASVALVASALLDATVAESVASFAALYALVAGAALMLDRPSPRVALGWTLGATAVVAAVASVVSVVAFQTALLSIPVALWFPLGRALGSDRWVTGFVAGALALSPFGAAVFFHPPASAAIALLGSLFTTIPWAAATVCFGVPLYLLGRELGRDGTVTGGTSPATRDPSV
ncbi:hypothetical protein ACFQMA_06060 [Halosimplex aquaticum]|uniref:Uncharacterized protein n=1 Tax=Halosimplex aquaticum TaxID=3026162 RepID=A0ABD5XZJ4_9EURY|nr:hypothetical protein [Halosimplex aquaticum]